MTPPLDIDVAAADPPSTDTPTVAGNGAARNGHQDAPPLEVGDPLAQVGRTGQADVATDAGTQDLGVATTTSTPPDLTVLAEQVRNASETEAQQADAQSNGSGVAGSRTPLLGRQWFRFTLVMIVVVIVVGGAAAAAYVMSQDQRSQAAPAPETAAPDDPRLSPAERAALENGPTTANTTAAGDAAASPNDGDVAAESVLPSLPTPEAARDATPDESASDASSAPSTPTPTPKQDPAPAAKPKSSTTESAGAAAAAPAASGGTGAPGPAGPAGPVGARGERGPRGEQGPGVAGLSTARVYASGKIDGRSGDFPSVRRASDGLYCLSGAKLAVVTVTVDAGAGGALAVASASARPNAAKCGADTTGFIQIQAVDGTPVNRPFYATVRSVTD